MPSQAGSARLPPDPALPGGTHAAPTAGRPRAGSSGEDEVVGRERRADVDADGQVRDPDPDGIATGDDGGLFRRPRVERTVGCWPSTSHPSRMEDRSDAWRVRVLRRRIALAAPTTTPIGPMLDVTLSASRRPRAESLTTATTPSIRTSGSRAPVENGGRVLASARVVDQCSLRNDVEAIPVTAGPRSRHAAAFGRRTGRKPRGVGPMGSTTRVSWRISPRDGAGAA